MRIGFDGRPLIGPRTGVGVWLEGLLRGLVAATDWEFSLLLPRAVAALGVEDLAPRVRPVHPAVPLPGTLWLTTVAGPSLAGRADVVVGTLGVLPRRVDAPAAVVVHDITPRTRPHHHTLANRFCFNAYVEDSVTRADAVVCVSNATRDRLAALMPSVARQALVIGEGVDPVFSPAPPGADPAPVRARFAGGRPFIVQIGTLEPRKGIATLLAAHAGLLARRPEAPDLVLAGLRGWGGDALDRVLAAHPAPHRVHLPGYVERADAVALLRHAEAVCVASDEEGFGLPLAEALACGAVCVASDDPALVEVSAGAARHVPRGDAAAFAAALEAALDDAGRAAWQARARTRAAELGWGPVVERWRELLAALAGARRA